MLNKNDAKKKIEMSINEPDPYWPDRPRFLILDGETIEKQWGWVFFYDSEKHIETDDLKDEISGNAPYIANKHTEEIEMTGTALPIEDYIIEYERKLSNSA